MTLYEYYLVYPDGDLQEISHELAFNQLVDLNGRPLSLPLPTAKMIVYRVFSISRKESRGEVVVEYRLELVTGNELFSLTNAGY